MFQHNERSVTNCTKTFPQISHNCEQNISSKLEGRKLKFLSRSVDNQNLLISSRSVPALLGNTLCRKVPVVGEVFLNKPLNSKYQTKGGNKSRDQW